MNENAVIKSAFENGQVAGLV